MLSLWSHQIATSFTYLHFIYFIYLFKGPTLVSVPIVSLGKYHNWSVWTCPFSRDPSCSCTYPFPPSLPTQGLFLVRGKLGLALSHLSLIYWSSPEFSLLLLSTSFLYSEEGTGIEGMEFYCGLYGPSLAHKTQRALC